MKPWSIRTREIGGVLLSDELYGWYDVKRFLFLMIYTNAGNYGCSFDAKFKFLYLQKHFHIQRKLYIQCEFLCIWNQRNFNMFSEFWAIFRVKEIFHIQKKIVFKETLLLIFRENIYIRAAGAGGATGVHPLFSFQIKSTLFNYSVSGHCALFQSPCYSFKY